MPEVMQRVGIGTGLFGGGGLLGALLTRALDTVEQATAPPSACQQALEIMSANISACLRMCGGG